MLKVKVTLNGKTAMTKREIDVVLSESILSNEDSKNLEMDEINFILPMCKQICQQLSGDLQFRCNERGK